MVCGTVTYGQQAEQRSRLIMSHCRGAGEEGVDARLTNGRPGIYIREGHKESGLFSSLLVPDAGDPLLPWGKTGILTGEKGTVKDESRVQSALPAGL